ncbi:PLDc N-terminal domain-containing protein [Paenibacillus sp. JCM 10914]|uniref:PLDc N-terminal domain-containing protein n=1 Tax=Paenibacillus sp. JCM 10914 TaxID=1236974 RepID=UPI000564F224|nr:PLDc N-terminal domain-containing protein [Paenibacillus sp. JCM 10914]
MENINWGLIWPIIALQLILAIVGLVSLAKSEAANIRGPKWMWVLILLLGNIIGCVAYFIIARKEA